jgi:hypothetical protein
MEQPFLRWQHQESAGAFLVTTILLEKFLIIVKNITQECN